MEFKEKYDALLREELVINCVTCAVSIIGFRRGMTPGQQIDFWNPWQVELKSDEEKAWQDCVWIYHVLPPHDEFNPDLAKDRYYSRLKIQALEKIWGNDAPIKEVKRHRPRANYSYQRKKLFVKPTSRKFTQTNGN